MSVTKLVQPTDDPALDLISEVFSERRTLRECLGRMPGMTDQRIRQLVNKRAKNGLNEFCTKDSDGQLYCFVPDFIAWVRRGRRPS